MEQPIGVIDSGVGGLTVVHELMRQLPKEKLIYLGDTLRCPYGSRTREEVQQFTWEMVQFLLQKNIKMLVVACNTATAYTLQDLQQHLPIPVVGVIKPGARAAINITNNNYVGVIGTEGTIKSQAYEKTLHRIKPELRVESLACPMFVPMVEQGILEGIKAEHIVQKCLQSFQVFHHMDTLILGCTHYPLIKNVIQKVIGENVTLVSSSEETARETSTILEVHHLHNNSLHRVNHEFFTTGELGIFTKITQKIFHRSIENLKTVKIEKAVI